MNMKRVEMIEGVLNLSLRRDNRYAFPGDADRDFPDGGFGAFPPVSGDRPPRPGDIQSQSDFKKNAKDMVVNLECLSQGDFGKRIAEDHEFYGKLVKDVKK
jgi:hypothetical protein